MCSVYQMEVYNTIRMAISFAWYTNKDPSIIMDTEKSLGGTTKTILGKERDMGRKKQEVEYRYYEMPANTFIIALTGPAWVESRRDDQPHYHNYLEIGYCHMGEGTMILEQGEYAFSKGYFIVVPPNMAHMTMNTEGVLTQWEYIYVDGEGFLKKWYKDNTLFTEEVLRRINGLSFCRHGREQSAITGLMQQIVRELQENGPYYREKVQGMTLTLLLEIARMNRQPVFKLPFRDRTGGIISEALNYVSVYYGRQLRVDELAARCCVSESYFRKVFGEVMGMTPMEYITLVRIHMACQLLEKTEDRVRDIAEGVGMPSLATFSRNFRKILGVSPGAWRKHSESSERKLRDYRIAVQQGWKRDWLWSHTMDEGKMRREAYEGQEAGKGGIQIF